MLSSTAYIGWVSSVININVVLTLSKYNYAFATIYPGVLPLKSKQFIVGIMLQIAPLGTVPLK